MLIDTHAHLNMDPLFGSWRMVADEAFLEGIAGIVVPSTDADTSKRALEIASLESRIVAGVGYHPETIGDTFFEQTALEFAVSSISAMTTQTHVAAIGEIGLDYFRLSKNPQAEQVIVAQRSLFKLQLQLAKELDLPALIHMRTDEAMRNTLADITAVYGNRQFRGVFHCFTGSYDFYEAISHWDISIGVGGMITYSHQQALQETVALIPLERIVLETDAPLLMPQPLAKGTNTPGNVTISACKLAQLKAVPLTTILETTGKNALRLFPQLQSL